MTGKKWVYGLLGGDILELKRKELDDNRLVVLKFFNPKRGKFHIHYCINESEIEGCL